MDCVSVALFIVRIGVSSMDLPTIDSFDSVEIIRVSQGVEDYEIKVRLKVNGKYYNGVLEMGE